MQSVTGKRMGAEKICLVQPSLSDSQNMPDNLFPKEIIENTAEANFGKHSLHTKLIYISVLLIIVGGLAALPFIHTNVSISSRGVIQPVTGRSSLTSPVTGTIKALYINENAYVKRGQNVAVIASPLLNEKLEYNRRYQQEYEQYLKDLLVLQTIDSSSIFSSYDLATLKYQRSVLAFKQQRRGILQKIKRVNQKYQRKKKLFDRKLISEASFEEVSYAYQSVRNEFQLMFEQQLIEWQADLISYRNELNKLKSEEQRILDKKENYVIKAPTSGSVLSMKGIYKGGMVYANQVLSEISPDARLIAECYLQPSSIGLIKEGMEVRYQISAYNFNQWGILTGEVLEISNDIMMVNNRPVFIVKASLDKTYLQLRNGYQGDLKKGMTLQARFTVARRSLFQLLFDNVNDWLNPKWDKPDQQEQQASI